LALFILFIPTVLLRMIVLPDQIPRTSPLARLVVIFAGLAIAASLVAGLWYLAVELPAQKNAEPPKNIKECRGEVYMIACMDAMASIPHGIPGGGTCAIPGA
jgi:hypothetical protein